VGCLPLSLHHKIEWKKNWFGCENFVLSDTIVQNWTSRSMSQTRWNIGGGPFCQVAFCALPSCWVHIDFTSLPNPHHQIANSMSPGLQCQFINSTSNCALLECCANCSEKRVTVLVYYPSYPGWFRTLSIILAIIIIIVMYNSTLY
jgi:hypothetical protein